MLGKPILLNIFLKFIKDNYKNIDLKNLSKKNVTPLAHLRHT